jgi:hypothetical protein
LDRFGITADTDGIDRADQQVALELRERRPQRFIGLGAGNGFEGDARP